MSVTMGHARCSQVRLHYLQAEEGKIGRTPDEKKLRTVRLRFRAVDFNERLMP